MEMSSVYQAAEQPFLSTVLLPFMLSDCSITDTMGTSLIYHPIHPNSHPDVLWPYTPTHLHTDSLPAGSGPSHIKPIIHYFETAYKNRNPCRPLFLISDNEMDNAAPKGRLRPSCMRSK